MINSKMISVVTIAVIANLLLKVQSSFGYSSYEIALCGREKGFGTTIDAARGASLIDPVLSTKGANSFDASLSYVDTLGLTGVPSHVNLVTLNNSGLTTILNSNGRPYIQSTSEQKESLSETIENPGLFDEGKPSFYDFSDYLELAKAEGTYYDGCKFYEEFVVAKKPVSGLVYVNIDTTKECSSYGYTPGNGSITWDSGSIEVSGTLVTDLYSTSGSPKPEFHLNIPLKINPIKGPVSDSTDLTPVDYQEFSQRAKAGRFNPSGASNPYEVSWNKFLKELVGDKRPPAFMHRGKFVRFAHQVNVSGVMYSTNFMSFHFWDPAISPVKDTVGFINGSIVTGVGLAITEHACGGGVFVSFDPNVVEQKGSWIPRATKKIGYLVD